MNRVFRGLPLLLATLVGIAVTDSQAGLAEDQIEVVPVESLTSSGRPLCPALYASRSGRVASNVFGLLRLPEGNGHVPAVVITLPA